MSNNAIIHFKCESRMYSLLLKISVEEMTLLLIEERIYKKLRLDVSKVKLRLSYYLLLVGCEEEFTISDDEDLCVYLTSMDKDNRRCVLYVEVINVSELPEQMSRVDKSSIGMNYEELQSKDVENGAQAITLYVEKENAVQEPQHEAVEDEDEVEDDLPRDVGVDISDSFDRYVEPPPVVKPSQFIEAWDDGLGFYVRQEFPSKAFLQDLVDRGAFNECFGYVVKKSDIVRLVLKCRVPSCKWSLRAAKVGETHIFSIRTYTNMHSCSRSSQSESNAKRKGIPQLVASILHDDYPRQMETPAPKIIMDLVKTKIGVDVSYSTTLRGKNETVRDLRGSSEGSYEMMYGYLYMLEKVNPGTVICVKLDEQNKFKYLFVALGARIEGFQVMRKVLVVDATFLKNGYGGCLVFASAQDPNRHNYPIAFAIIDGEKTESWTWFFEVLKTVIADSSELVFVSDRNASLIDAIANVYPQAHHGYCVWHLSQNVKAHASNVNKDTIYNRFMEMSALYTVVEFETAYSSFKSRFPSATEYLEKTTVKKKWAKCCFPGEMYNLETSNIVESLNKTFKEARRYALIPLLDAILKRLSKWFNEHQIVAT